MINKEILDIIEGRRDNIEIEGYKYHVYFGTNRVLLVYHPMGILISSDIMKYDVRYLYGPIEYRLAVDKVHEIQRAWKMYKRKGVKKND